MLIVITFPETKQFILGSNTVVLQLGESSDNSLGTVIWIVVPIGWVFIGVYEKVYTEVTAIRLGFGLITISKILAAVVVWIVEPDSFLSILNPEILNV